MVRNFKWATILLGNHALQPSLDLSDISAGYPSICRVADPVAVYPDPTPDKKKADPEPTLEKYSDST